jgi:hypothetical protein
MPTVPVYQRQVAESPLPTVRGDPNAAAGAFTTAPPVDLSGVTRVAQQLHEEEVQKNNAMVVNNAERQLGDLRTSLMFDPETGAINQKGHAALGAPADVAQRWQQGVAKIREGLKLNGDTDRAFSQREQGYWANLNESVQSHVSAELKKQDVADVGALLANGLDEVNHDPTTADKNVEIAKARIADFAKRNDWSPEEQAQKTAAHVSDIHAAAISRLVAMGTPEAAQQASDYLTAHRKELVGGQLDDAEKLVDEGVAQGLGQRQADAILGIGPAVLPDSTQKKAIAATGQEDATPPQQPRATSMVDALNRAEQIADSKQRKAATDAIVAHFTHLEQAKRIERGDALIAVTKQIEASGGRLNRASPEWLKIDGTPEGEQALHRQEQLLHPPKDPGNPDAFMHYNSLNGLNAASTKEFLSLNIPQLAKQEGLNDSQANQLISAQRIARGQTGRGDAAHAVEAERLRFERETALLKVGDPTSAHYIADKAERDLEVARIKLHYNQLQAAHGLPTSPTSSGAAPSAPSATTGNVDFSAPHVDPLAGHLTPRLPVPVDWQARVLADPKYKNWLSNNGYDVESVRPPVVVKK